MRYLQQLFIGIAINFTLLCCTTSPSKKSNELLQETSPYLLQHAYNPVNWKAWNPKTLEQAKNENKLIIISIGYAACHWCHVMEEESFENDSIAKIMNENFINIKVDREERPDVDNTYMTAVQLMTGSGGWPLNCIALPNGKPIFGGTYFTKKQWKNILEEVSALYKENPRKLKEFAEKITKGIRENNIIKPNNTPTKFTENILAASVDSLKINLDYTNGGFLRKQKFPLPNALDFLMRFEHQYKDTVLQKYLNTSLTKMAYGGIYDHIRGGFSRYTIEEEWRIPHFEKMLYDNAQLVSLYAKAYQKEKKTLYKNVAVETLDFILQEMTSSNGAFYTSIDADSKDRNGDMEEGAFYVWKKEELEAILQEDFALFSRYFSIDKKGYWEDDKYILQRTTSKNKLAIAANISEAQLEQKVNNWKKALLEIRGKRSRPATDKKVLTSWNAMMLKGFIDAYRAFDQEVYLNTAIKNAEFIVKNQFKKDGGLYRNYKDNKSTINAYAEDYAAVIDAFIALYEVTLEEKWLQAAKELMEYAMQYFYDENTKMFNFSSKEDKDLISKKTAIIDGVIPSSNSQMARNLHKLSLYFSDKKMNELAILMLNNVINSVTTSPQNFTNWLHLLMSYTLPYYEVAIVGENVSELAKEMYKLYIPNIIFSGTSDTTSTIPLLKSKYVSGQTLIYVCTNGTCKLPKRKLPDALPLISGVK
ncbi:thioredoxin domain-containing protein [Tenacibaculum sp. SG-28]|uniref:thioredoxin domain-containing protein n=1 Tax=Tenacibaculum sp. SG-28 TaxID=754426 RepID=UPI000CF4C562|nr:thioredoxin domain-containing protein [Tenacibaculum sp. SG-28]